MHTNNFVLRFETNIAKPGPTLQTSTSTASLKGGHSNAELGYPTTGGGHKSSAVYQRDSALRVFEQNRRVPGSSALAVLSIASGLQSETGTVKFREGMSLLVGEKCRNRPHRHVDVIGAIPVRECFKLAQNVIPVFVCERWNSNTISHRSVA